jgi:hypothetical protein
LTVYFRFFIYISQAYADGEIGPKAGKGKSPMGEIGTEKYLLWEQEERRWL